MIIIIYLFKFYLFIFPLLQPINTNGPNPGGDPGVPITGGILILVASALGLGIKTFLKKKKD